ncbi:DNA-directed RNA polymerase subunit alpha [Patescibacteria group bacterium]|nr:DNA-directed RNA polymerase subunit alpha [Patescibacteria group bacterium]MBU4057576.1 DNA-directed RNA polymerase subunit alpha [Patescibacteria group bacterium]MBU4115886.1 DNA-directed RNA polymerase subunit alpha [Patescibacteria group bacterium]
MDYDIVLPSQPKIIKEEDFEGVYEIEGLYPGYGHTLGNSLRRIILSSLPGAAIVSVKIDGVDHEFTTMDGVREDVINILLNLKKIRIKMDTEEPQMMYLKIKGEKEIKAGDIEVPGQMEILNPGLVVAHTTNKNASLNIEMKVQRGLGYIPKETIEKDRVDIGSISLDAIFSPIRRVNYEVEDMRVGERTNFNRLRIFIETDGTMTSREVLEKSIGIMIKQLKAIVGFQEDEEESIEDIDDLIDKNVDDEKEISDGSSTDKEFFKTRIESLGLSVRTENALKNASIRTVGGLTRKKEEDILEIEGLGKKGLDEIKKLLKSNNVSLKTG